MLVQTQNSIYQVNQTDKTVLGGRVFKTPTKYINNPTFRVGYNTIFLTENNLIVRTSQVTGIIRDVEKVG